MKPSRQLRTTVALLVKMPRWTLARVLRHIQRFFCCGRIVVNRKQMHERRRRRILQIINRKGFYLSLRDHKMRTDLLNKKLIQKLLAPDEMEVVKSLVIGRRNQITHAQQEELERKLAKSEKSKSILNQVMAGTKEKSIANLELFIMHVLNRKCSGQSRNTAQQNKRKAVESENEIQTVESERENENEEKNDSTESEIDVANLEIDIELDAPEGENEVQTIEKKMTI